MSIEPLPIIPASRDTSNGAGFSLGANPESVAHQGFPLVDSKWSMYSSPGRICHFSATMHVFTPYKKLIRRYKVQIQNLLYTERPHRTSSPRSCINNFLKKMQINVAGSVGTIIFYSF